MPADLGLQPHRQLALLDLPRDLKLACCLRKGFPPPPDPGLEAAFHQFVRDYATAGVEADQDRTRPPRRAEHARHPGHPRRCDPPQRRQPCCPRSITPPQSAINPHLFIHARRWDTTRPVTGWWIRHQLGLCGQRIRFDRILDEAHATGGDIRRLIDLFGLSFETASRYASTVNRLGSDERQ